MTVLCPCMRISNCAATLLPLMASVPSAAFVLIRTWLANYSSKILETSQLSLLSIYFRQICKRSTQAGNSNFSNTQHFAVYKCCMFTRRLWPLDTPLVWLSKKDHWYNVTYTSEQREQKHFSVVAFFTLLAPLLRQLPAIYCADIHTVCSVGVTSYLCQGSVI